MTKRREVHVDFLGGCFPERGAGVRRLAGFTGKAEITANQSDREPVEVCEIPTSASDVFIHPFSA